MSRYRTNLVRRAPMNDEIRVIADGDDHNPWNLLIWAALCFFALAEGMQDDIHNLSPASNPFEEGAPMRIFIAEAALSFALISAATQFPDAPTGFDNKTNGMVDDATHQADQVKFEEVEQLTDGLGPLYNAQSCAECHQSPASGGASQVSELRVGHNGPG